MQQKDLQYKYDLAISLCKQDVEFARKLVKSLNPKLNVFFYEDRQEEIVTKLGPDVFAKVFKEESRLVLILSRKEWGDSYYTDLERSAIVDRTTRQNQGYGFLMVIPMVSGEIPPWYPSTYIYVSPTKFQIDELVRFIEFKITDQGGEIKPLDVAEQYDHLLKRMDEKKELVRLQETPEAISKAKEELQAIRAAFFNKTDLLKSNQIGTTTLDRFYPNANTALFGIGKYSLVYRFNAPSEFQRPVTTQDYVIKMMLLRVRDGHDEEIIEQEIRLFYYSKNVSGWSIQIEYQDYSAKEVPIMFRDRENKTHYDLDRPISSSKLIDDWFKKLLALSAAKIERLL